MFNSNLRRVFDEDPFFSDPFQVHRDHMRHMMRSFSEPFGGPWMPSTTDGRQGGDAGDHPRSSRALQENHRDISRSWFPFGSADTDSARNPFSLLDDTMVNVRNRMGQISLNFENPSPDSNTHSFSSSSIVTYSKVGNEPPKVFQASSSTGALPGGYIKETRRAVKDSESGVEKMAIGHHIHDRGHVVEKKYNKKTGDKELNRNFHNMDE
ncbi:unnamed protein product, partial [Tetraodon nigroviridis]